MAALIFFSLLMIYVAVYVALVLWVIHLISKAIEPDNWRPPYGDKKNGTE